MIKDPLPPWAGSWYSATASMVAKWRHTDRFTQALRHTKELVAGLLFVPTLLQILHVHISAWLFLYAVIGGHIYHTDKVNSPRELIWSQFYGLCWGSCMVNNKVPGWVITCVIIAHVCFFEKLLCKGTHIWYADLSHSTEHAFFLILGLKCNWNTVCVKRDISPIAGVYF